MNMREFYERMEETLAYFGLRFHEMGKVEVRFLNTAWGIEVRFTYGDQHVSYSFKESA